MRGDPATSAIAPEHADERLVPPRWRRLTDAARARGIWVALVLLFVASGILSPAILQVDHLINVVQVASFLGIAAIGQTLIILTGGIDLSVGGTITLVNVVSAQVMGGQPEMMLPATLLCLALGAVVGLVNGLLVTWARITPLIVTLSMNALLFGGALVYTGGAPKGAIPKEYLVLGQGRIAGFLPVPVLIWIVLTAAAWVLTRRTTFGRRLYAVGANPRAAELLGVRVNRVIVIAYVLGGLTAATTGLLRTAFIGLPALGIGEQYLLNSIAAVVVGGTALTGGVGSVLASAAGALFMTQLNSLTNILRVETGSQYVIQGVIIAAGIALYTLGRRR